MKIRAEINEFENKSLENINKNQNLVPWKEWNW